MAKKINKTNTSNKGKYLDERYKIEYILMKFLNEWASVLVIILKPFSLISIILSLVSLYLAQTQTGNNRLIFEILSGLIFSLAGGILAYYFVEYMGNSLVIKKSIGAIRNLQLIKSKIDNVNDRISNLQVDGSGEVANLVANIHKDILNSISDWADVNPNAEYLTDYYEIIDSTKKEKIVLKEEVSNLEIQKNKIDQTKTEEISKLSREIDEKNKEISKLNSNLFGLQQNVGTISASGATGPSYPVTLSSVNITTLCKNCGYSFSTFPNILGVNICPRCRTEN